MIVPMKVVTLVFLEKYRNETLAELQSLGVVHVSGRALDEKSDRRAVKQRIEEVEKLLGVLADREKSDRSRPMELKGRELVDYALLLMSGKEEMSKKLEAAERELSRFSGWGCFDENSINDLRSKGINVYLCCGSRKDVETCSGMDGR